MPVVLFLWVCLFCAMADMYKILPESDDEQISIEKKIWLEIPGAGTIRCMFVVKVGPPSPDASRSIPVLTRLC